MHASQKLKQVDMNPVFSQQVFNHQNQAAQVQAVAENNVCLDHEQKETNTETRFPSKHQESLEARVVLLTAFHTAIHNPSQVCISITIHTIWLNTRITSDPISRHDTTLCAALSV